jgi:hypothetical protein
MDIAPEKAGIRVQAGSGSLWRIRRVRGVPAGERPKPSTRVPFYALQYLTWAAGLAAIVGAAIAAVRWAFRRRDRR